ncbi:MAG: GTPase ObgE [bacterium]
MKLIDELAVHIKAGRGGDGVVRWLQEKFKPMMGPAGGNGGKGGDVFVRAVSDINVLAKYKNTKDFVAEDGKAGERNSRHGANGEDLYIDLPIGSIVKNLTTGKSVQLLTTDQVIKILDGGRGGLGNEHFKGSVNQRPKEWTPGKDGDEGDFEVELELIADAGLIGLPNAGKSSLLNELTNAHSKVGSYQFTTLEPALGDMHGMILADIPGLIEGASEGRGLGDKFLRHIKRTKLLVHCLSLENENLLEAYDTIRGELEAYSPELAKKNEIVVLTKTDVLTNPKDLEKAVKKISKRNSEIYTVSILDDKAVKGLKDELIKIIRVERKKVEEKPEVSLEKEINFE